MAEEECERGSPGAAHPTLDPDDWPAFRALAHQALDDALDGLMHLRRDPVWREPTPEARSTFDAPIPEQPTPLSEVLATIRTDIAPFTSGNRHPRFMGWVQGAGTPAGVIAEMMSAALNMNCGGRNHIGLDVERQITRWMAEVLGFPETASGLFLTGSSMANFLAVLIARTAALGPDARSDGMATPEASRLTGYTSKEAHSCISRAFDMAGLGTKRLRFIDTDDRGRMRPDALAAAIEQDKVSGHHPFFCVATSGTVNTGAFDPLEEIAAIAESAGLWLHVDGAIGALAAFSPNLQPKLNGVSRAQSIAMDFHKSGHVPYDAGFLLVKDRYKHALAFSSPTAYLQRAERGLAAGGMWPVDLGPDLSRGFRALKTWLTLKAFGTSAIGQSIETTTWLAKELAAKIEKSSELELKAPVEFNIVCLGVTGANASAINRETVIELQTRGIAAPSSTEIRGETIIRLAIINHRTTADDLDITLNAILEISRRIRTQGSVSS